MAKIKYSTLKKLCSTNRNEVEESFNFIFNKYRYLVYYVAFELVNNVEDAKDIVNETFLKMYEKRTTFNEESKLKYYLLVTAKNLSINLLKSKNDHLEYNDEVSGSSDSGSPSIYLEKFKELLDKDEFDYLVLHLIYEFSFREIANFRHLTTSQVSSKYARGIKKLRNYYGGKDNE